MPVCLGYIGQIEGCQRHTCVAWMKYACNVRVFSDQREMRQGKQLLHSAFRHSLLCNLKWEKRIFLLHELSVIPWSSDLCLWSMHSRLTEVFASSVKRGGCKPQPLTCLYTQHWERGNYGSTTLLFTLLLHFSTPSVTHSNKELADYTIDMKADIYACWLSIQMRCWFQVEDGYIMTGMINNCPLNAL